MVRRYTRVTEARKAQIIEEARGGGGTVKSVARRHRVSPSSIYRWQRIGVAPKKPLAAQIRREAERLHNDALEMEERARLTEEASAGLYEAAELLETEARRAAL